MYWKDRVRDLTPEEEKLIHDYVLSCCDKGEEDEGEVLYRRILDKEEVKMDFLDFAKNKNKMDLGAIFEYIIYD